MNIKGTEKLANKVTYQVLGTWIEAGLIPSLHQQQLGFEFLANKFEVDRWGL